MSRTPSGNHRGRRIATGHYDPSVPAPGRNVLSGDLSAAFLQAHASSSDWVLDSGTTAHTSNRPPYGLVQSAGDWHKQTSIRTATRDVYKDESTFKNAVHQELGLLKHIKEVTENNLSTYHLKRKQHLREIQGFAEQIVALRWTVIILKAAHYEKQQDIGEAFALRLSEVKLSFFRKRTTKFEIFKYFWERRESLANVFRKVYEGISLILEIYLHFATTKTGAAATTAFWTAAFCYYCKLNPENPELEHLDPEAPGPAPEVELLQ